MLEIGERLIPTDFEIIVSEESKRNRLILGTPFLATAGAIIDYMKNRISLGNVREYIFFQSINFKTAPSEIKIQTEKATQVPKNGAMSTYPKKSEHYPKPKEAMKPSKLKHEDVFKDINSILAGQDPDPKEDHTAKEKLGNSLNLLSAFVFKDGKGDDLGVPKPPHDPPESENEEAKGIPNPLVYLPRT
ncbi:unnamed protein product [Microthlaspi erraticum]|uniref:Uncharacterized protein n=1 Tax=Microthlaspi erraticum TaxID=1685480 RepID=A0A6D2IRS6_9BRAS|nr:unnamed protein product [Microthlaspi erraticum]